jgi:hypothetical protein
VGGFNESARKLRERGEVDLRRRREGRREELTGREGSSELGERLSHLSNALGKNLSHLERVRSGGKKESEID